MSFCHITKYHHIKTWWRQPESGFTREEIVLIHNLVDLELDAKEIARRDGVTERTVVRKLKKIYEKVGVENLEQAITTFTQASAFAPKVGGNKG